MSKTRLSPYVFDYEEADPSPADHARAKILVAAGYKQTSRKYRMVSRKKAPIGCFVARDSDYRRDYSLTLTVDEFQAFRVAAGTDNPWGRPI